MSLTNDVPTTARVGRTSARARVACVLGVAFSLAFPMSMAADRAHGACTDAEPGGATPQGRTAASAVARSDDKPMDDVVPPRRRPPPPCPAGVDDSPLDRLAVPDPETDAAPARPLPRPDTLPCPDESPDG